MSIEIKITDIARLTLEEIDSLYKYLLESAKPLQIQASFTPLHESCRTCDEEEIVPDAITELNGQAFRYGKPVKTRKKRTPKPVPLATSTPHDIPTPVYVEEATVSYTYEELIAFVLEGTRTHQLTFDKVMTVLNFYNIPNLNSVNEYPQFINEIYNALRETMK